ncbi:PepSY domain-containing protein [Kaarinaea lacus]
MFNMLLKRFVVILLALPLVGFAKDIDQDDARALKQQGIILSLEQILQAAQRVHPGRVIEVDLEQKRNLYIYEVEIADSNGQVWEMKFNASDATLLSDERED